MPAREITRLAPSPTGALHLGNARTFLINWALAKQQDWSILLRIEDLDGPRVKAEASEQAIDILQWLGLDWNDGPMYQTHDLSPYCAALDTLQRKHLTYPCTCSRKDIESAQSAPHGDEHELRYPGTCRPPKAGGLQVLQPAIRLLVPDEPIAFIDALHGAQTINVQQQVGDFIVATKAGLPAYQLAVVVDDARQGVTQVVRGDDLLPSTARQVLLYRLLDLGDPPRYTHLPLVIGADGRRLAKRHGDTRLTTYRDAGVAAECVIGLLAYWSGVTDQRERMSAADFAAAFDLDRLPRGSVTFTEDDDQWLRRT